MMQVNLSTQNCNNTNFRSLKGVNCSGTLYRTMGSDIYHIENRMMQNLKSNNSFKELCKKFDVYVNILPYTQPARLLSLEIFIKENLKGLFGIPIGTNSVPVAGFIAHEKGANNFQLADSITKNYINCKEGLDADIAKFIQSN